MFFSETYAMLHIKLKGIKSLTTCKQNYAFGPQSNEKNKHAQTMHLNTMKYTTPLQSTTMNSGPIKLPRWVGQGVKHNLSQKKILYSRAPDLDFRCLYPCEIILSISHTGTSPAER